MQDIWLYKWKVDFFKEIFDIAQPGLNFSCFFEYVYLDM